LLNLSGAAKDDVGVAEVTWTNNRGGSGRATGTTSWSIANAFLQSGVNVFTVVAQDTAGNKTSASVSVTRDAQAPTVSIVTPAVGTFVTNKAAVALAGKAGDDTGVKQVTWQNSRGGSGTASGTSDWSVSTVALLAGTNNITITARDGSGKVGTATLTVILDARAPVISIATPTTASSFTTTETSLALGGVATDDTGLAEVSWTNSTGGSGAAAGTATWSTPRIALKAGLNTLTVTARDQAGNTASATLAVTVKDVRAPGVRILVPTAESTFTTASAAINLEGEAVDDVGLARIAWVNDRGGSGVVTPNNRWAAGSVALQLGVNMITVTATDAAGNSASDVIRVTYELGLPKIALTSPTQLSTYATSSPNVALTGVASDNGGSITGVKWSTDKGQSGDAVGTTSWSIPLVTVPMGTTVVTVTAYDNAGNAASVKLSVVYGDTSKPTVKIYTPTTASSLTTFTSSVTIAGTALDNVGVTQVMWSTDRGATGTAFGIGSWSTPSIALPLGTTTVVTITARDAAGNTGVAVLSVTAASPATSDPNRSVTASN
ncbi:MAG TPA: Ig-like domain-containing protein, partial [Vicinamibacterales bacterium]|nr:Ig-like domain-containing protein [Vicinamibacterales bacterium]